MKIFHGNIELTIEMGKRNWTARAWGIATHRAFLGFLTFKTLRSPTLREAVAPKQAGASQEMDADMLNWVNRMEEMERNQKAPS